MALTLPINQSFSNIVIVRKSSIKDKYVHWGLSIFDVDRLIGQSRL